MTHTYVTVYKTDFYNAKPYLDNIRRLHGAVNRAMGCEQTGRLSASVLFCVEDDQRTEETWLYIQGNKEGPETVDIFTRCSVYCMDNKLARIQNNDVVEFNLRCSPLRHQRVPDEGQPHRKRKYFNTENERRMWLDRQGKRMGFAVERYGENGKTGLRFCHGNMVGHKDTVNMMGLLRVTDATLFKSTIRHGIGSGKAYGCGMLFVR